MGENLASGQTLEELSIGNWFDGDELIIEKGGRRMTAVRRYDDGELRTFCYDLGVENGIVQSITCNGGQEYYPKDEGYSELMLAIKNAENPKTTSLD